GYWESEPLRARIARHYRERYRVDVDPERIILTCGASPALLLALLARFDAGDRIAFARPGYVAYRNTTRAAHLVPLEIGWGRGPCYQLSDAAIAALDPAPAGVTVAGSANPAGRIIPGDELSEIARVCRERGIVLVSHEIYHGLHYTRPAHSILAYAPDAL